MDGMEGPIDMAIDKALLDQLLAGREVAAMAELTGAAL